MGWTSSSSNSPRRQVVKVRADVAVLAVRRWGQPCTSATLRQWVARGHIRRYRGNCYDLTEILTYLQTRAVPA